VLVPLGELGGDLIQEDADPVFRQRYDSGDDAADPLRISRTDWP
jgi:hypothetical protein